MNWKKKEVATKRRGIEGICPICANQNPDETLLSWTQEQENIIVDPDERIH